MVLKVLPVSHSCNSPKLLPSQETQMINWAKNNLCFSLFIALALWLLHQQHEKNERSTRKLCGGFDALIISIMFCFTGSFGALFIRNKPQLAKLRIFYFILSMVSMASALSILAFSLFFESFRLVSPGSILWQNEDREDHLQRLVLFLKKNSQRCLEAMFSRIT